MHNTVNRSYTVVVLWAYLLQRHSIGPTSMADRGKTGQLTEVGKLISSLVTNHLTVPKCAKITDFNVKI